MALLQYRNIADYTAQKSAFEEFLTKFRTSPTESLAQAISQVSFTESDLDLDSDEDLLSPQQNENGNGNGNGNGDRTRSRRNQHDAPVPPRDKYQARLQNLADRRIAEFAIDLDDVAAWESANGDELQLVSSIERNTRHYVELLSQAVDAKMPQPTTGVNFKDDVLDVLLEKRRQTNAEAVQNAEETNNPELLQDQFPAQLTRRYTLVFHPRVKEVVQKKALAVRQVRGEHLGHLITVRGIATRVSDVKPLVLVNAYTCDRCGTEIFQPVSDEKYAPLSLCPSQECRDNQSKGQLFPSTRASKFVAFQDVKIQELAEQVPIGQIPRTLTVSCLGSLVRTMNPGDTVDITGVFLPRPYTGFKALRAGLLTDTYLEAHEVRQHKVAYDDMAVDEKLLGRIQRFSQSGMVYDMMARSIAPEIFGHLDVKKALLLLLVGGVTKEAKDGMRIRGDINICMMGDPGVAKSQLLKYISKVAPRGVYTSGRGSSGVGLTAAVMRDPLTEEMVLEGGALVLADNGVCCIDEFDKMDENDRTAIHEVMEQQTISISKAGISTTLNARTSILAAANPIYGRYNPRISPVENINLPAALLSRFDVMFLLLDTPERELDAQLAKHVTYVHTHGKHPDLTSADASTTVFTPHEVRAFIARARSFRPVVPASVTEYITRLYARLRKAQRVAEAKGQHTFAYVSPRTMLGIVRLAQALARLRFAGEVIQEDVDEAMRIVDASKESLALQEPRRGGRKDASTRIMELVKGLVESGACRWTEEGDADADADAEDAGVAELDLRRVRERVLAKGFTEDQWMGALEEYEGIDVWQTAGNGTRLVFVNAAVDEDEDEDMN